MNVSKSTISSREKMKEDLLDSMGSKFNLKVGMCSWPMGGINDDEFHFCSEVRVDGLPYCAKHQAMAYVKDKKFTKRH